VDLIQFRDFSGQEGTWFILFCFTFTEGLYELFTLVTKNMGREFKDKLSIITVKKRKINKYEGVIAKE
jgi:hypothetical protein